MPVAWFFLTWAAAFIGLIACLHSSWPRALAFNAGVAAATLAAAEAYFASHELEPPSYSTSYTVRDQSLGWGPARNARTRATRFHHGKPVYDVSYAFDSNGLRVAPPAGEERVAGTVLFFGCSFTFGEGLQDDETLPYQVGAQSGGRWRTFNFAFHGYGPNQMLAAIEDGRVRRIVDSRPRYAFYVTIPDHLVRVAGRIPWGANAPRYRLDREGTARLDGCFRDEHRTPGFLESLLLRIDPRFVHETRWQLDKSAIYRTYATRPSVPAKADVPLLMAIVRRSRELLLADYPDLKFHVIFWPSHYLENRRFYWEMIDGFRQLNLPVHRVQDILPGYDVEVPTEDQTRYLLPTDGHPNALANRLVAKYLVTKVLRAGRNDD
jgi:hypothetical protein